MKTKALTAAQIAMLAQRLSETPIEPATSAKKAGDTFARLLAARIGDERAARAFTSIMTADTFDQAEARLTLVLDYGNSDPAGEAIVGPADELKAAPAPVVGKRKVIFIQAQSGALPQAPDFSKPTHARFRAKLVQIVALAEAGDIAALQAFEINPVSSKGPCSSQQEIHRDLRDAKLGEVVVEGGPGPVLHDAAERVHLHVFAGLGMLAPHQLQLAVHHFDQRVGTIEDAQRGLALDVTGQDDVVMRDPRQREAAHRPPFAGADSGGSAEGDGGQQVQHTLVLLDDHRPLGDALEAEQSDLAKAGVEVGQDVDGLRHLGQRVTASVKGIADQGHGMLRGCEGDQTPSRAMMPTVASWAILALILAASLTVPS